MRRDPCTSGDDLRSRRRHFLERRLPGACRIWPWSCTTTAASACTSAGLPCHGSIAISRAWPSSKRYCVRRRGSPKDPPTAFGNSGTLGDGWLERYGIDAVVHELNCSWIAGLKDYSSSRHWRDYGANLAEVFHDYFVRVKPVDFFPTSPSTRRANTVSIQRRASPRPGRSAGRITGLRGRETTPSDSRRFPDRAPDRHASYGGMASPRADVPVVA